MKLHELLERMVKKDASDMFVTAKLPVSAKINGELQPIDDVVLTAEESLGLVYDAMNDKQKNQFNNCLLYTSPSPRD